MKYNISQKHCTQPPKVHCKAMDMPINVIIQSEKGSPILIRENKQTLGCYSFTCFIEKDITYFKDTYVLQPKGTVFVLTQTKLS